MAYLILLEERGDSPLEWNTGCCSGVGCLMGHQRDLFRIALERSGEVRRGDQVRSCDVVDLTEKGVQIKTTLDVEVGETLQLKFSLTATCTIHCTIQVTRISTPYLGACISDISPDDQEHLSQFIEQLIALNLGAG